MILVVNRDIKGPSPSEKKSEFMITVEKASTLKAKPASDSLVFGKNFTDHMFTARYSEEEGWHELKIGPYKNFDLAPSACVLHYGQAVFEGIKVHRCENGKLAWMRPEFNWERLAKGCERLCMQAPPKEVFLEGIKNLIMIEKDWVPDAPHSSLYIRPTVIGTEGFLGIRPAKEYLFFVILSPVGSYYSGGLAPVKIWVETQYLRAAPGGLGSIKAAANYAGSLKASEKAKANGYSQVLWLDVQKKHIEEVGSMNVFFVFENEIVTPSLGDTVLAGKTRDSVIQLLKSNGHNVVERKLSLEEVRDANERGALKEVFGTGTAVAISPVSQLGNEDMQIIINNGEIGEISKTLFKQLEDIQYGRVPDPFGWIEYIE